MLTAMLPMGLEGEGRSLSLGTNSRPTVHLTEVETPFIWKKREPMAYSKLLTHGIPQTPVLKRVVKTAGTIREQPGEENIPDDPKRS
jgi:hypothetical protein